MNTLSNQHFATFGSGALPLSLAFAELRAGITWPHYHAHGCAALASALNEGLMPEEVASILDGRGLIEAFPVWQGETPADYAVRTVAEMFVVYLQ